MLECGYMGGAGEAPEPIEVGELQLTADGGITFRVFEVANMLPVWRTAVTATGAQVLALGVETDKFLERGGRANAFVWGGVAGMAMRDRKVNRKNTPLVALLDRGAAEPEVVVFGTLAAEADAWLDAARAVRATAGLATPPPHEVLGAGPPAVADEATGETASPDRSELVAHAQVLREAGVMTSDEFAEIAGRIAGLP